MNFRRSTFLCLSLILVISNSVGCRRYSSRTAVPARPNLSIVTPVVELRAGDDDQSSHQTAIIRIQNTGNAPIAIASISTGCGCAVVNDTPQTPLESGSTAEIAIRVHLPEFGDQTVAVQITTTPLSDVPLRVELKLHGKPRPVPRLLHPLGDLRVSMSSGSTAKTAFVIQTWEQLGSSPWLCGFDVDLPRCRLVMEEPPVEKVLTTELVERRYLARLEVESVPAPEELKIAYVVPKFSLPTVPAIPFRVLIESRPKIRALPAVINVSRASLPTKRQIFLQSDSYDWTCTLDKDLPEWIKLASIDDVGGPSQRMLKLTLAISAPPEPLSAPALIKCLISDPEVGSIVIPIYVSEER